MNAPTTKGLKLGDLAELIPHSTDHLAKAVGDPNSTLAQVLNLSPSSAHRYYKPKEVELIWAWCFLREARVTETNGGTGNGLACRILRAIQVDGWPDEPWTISTGLVTTWIKGRPKQLRKLVEGDLT